MLTNNRPSPDNRILKLPPEIFQKLSSWLGHPALEEEIKAQFTKLYLSDPNFRAYDVDNRLAISLAEAACVVWFQAAWEVLEHVFGVTQTDALITHVLAQADSNISSKNQPQEFNKMKGMFKEILDEMRKKYDSTHPVESFAIQEEIRKQLH